MKGQKGIVIGVAVVLALIGGYYYFVQEKSVQEQWQAFKASDGRFEVLFPLPPQQNTTKMPLKNGEEVMIYNSYSVNGQEGEKYILNTVQYPSSFDISKPNELLQKFLRDTTTSLPPNKIIGQSSINFQNHPAIDFDLQNFQFATLGRAIFAGTTLYVLTVVDPDRSKLEARFQAFTDSLKILE
jgi:hypothetical protein